MNRTCYTTLLFLLLTTSIYGQQFNSSKIQLLGRWYLNPVPDTTLSRTYMGVYGYAQNGREYAIQSACNGTYIVDITLPASPTLVSFIPSRENRAGWREYRVYKNYLYMVSDGSHKGGLQIADLSYLPDSAHIVFAEDSIWANSHTITIDEDKMYGNSTSYKTHAGINTPVTIWHSMSVYSLSNPEKPSLIKHLDQDISNTTIKSVHDSYVVNDTIYASAGFDGLWVLNIDSTGYISPLGHTNSSYQGYNHSSCLTQGKTHIVMLEEISKSRPAMVVDVSDLSDMDIVAEFSSGSKATPHNPYLCRNGFVAIAYYQDGLQIFDLNNPLSPKLAGYFDTHYQSTDTLVNGNYEGAWGAYTELPSGLILVSDMQNGLFILNADSVLGATEPTEYPIEVKLYPNPATHSVKIRTEGTTESSHAVIYNLLGQTLSANTFKYSYTFDISAYSSGVYPVVVETGGEVYRLKLVVR